VLERKGTRPRTMGPALSATAAAFFSLLLCCLALLPSSVDGLAGGFPVPEGVDSQEFAKVIPILVSALTQCGGPGALVDALNVFTANDEFIQGAIQSVVTFEQKEENGKAVVSKTTYENPFVEGALTILTSQGMTDLIKDPTFIKLSDSLNMTCVLNRPEVEDAIAENAKTSLAKATNETSAFNSIDKITFFIEAGLLADVASSIGPAFVDCGGNLRILLQFAQAFAYFILGNRDRPDREKGELNPALNKYNNDSPVELYTKFQCAERGYSSSI